MHVELLETLARVWCDREWCEQGKITPPSVSEYGYIGLDNTRLAWLVAHGYVQQLSSDNLRYPSDGGLATTAKGRDALFHENLCPSKVSGHLHPEECWDCGEQRWSCQVVPDTHVTLCVDCYEDAGQSISPNYVRYEHGMPVPVVAVSEKAA